MNQHYCVVSDLHLTDVEDHDDGWKAYKSERFVYDDDLAQLVQGFMHRHGGDAQLTLIFNGDIFDFDLVTAVPDEPPWPVSAAERKRGLDPTEPKSVWKLQRILSHHPQFLTLLAQFAVAGHRVVFVLGNHDRELHFQAVRQQLVLAIEAHSDGAQLSEAITFEPWFYYVPGEIYAEHGHQFDYYNSFKNQLSPVVDGPEGPMIALPMGNLTNRCLMTQMGFFNPHASDFVLNFLHYIQHWARHYLFSRRSLIFSWFWGSLVVIASSLRLKKRLLGTRAPHSAQLDEIARRYGVPTFTIKQLNRLHRRPITNQLYRIVREFWLDRLLLALVMTGGTIALALVPVPLWIKLMVPLSAFPLLYFIYEWLVQGETIFSVDQRLPEYAQVIATLLPVRVVTFGHTHRPRLLALSKETSFVDTGAWAPVTMRGSTQELLPGMRTYLLVSIRGSEATVRLESWMPRT